MPVLAAWAVSEIWYASANISIRILGAHDADGVAEPVPSDLVNGGDVAERVTSSIKRSNQCLQMFTDRPAAFAKPFIRQ